MSDEINKSELVNPNLDNGREHRVGADLYDWEINDTYDINRVVPDVKTFIDQLYTHSLYSQEVLCDVSRIYGTMSKFTRDVNTNKDLGIGYYNYTLEVPMKNIRCFKTLAIKRANPRIYTIEDTCKMTDLFERRLMMFIDGQYFPAVKFYATENRFVLIIEVNDGNVSLNQMKAWMENDVKWSILMLPFSNAKRKTGLQSDIIKGRTIPFTALDNIATPMFVNRNIWLVSVGSTSSDKAVTTSTIATMVENDKGELGLELNSKFVLGIKPLNINVNALAIPNVKGSILLNTARAFQIELDTNPIPPQNIICWETDKDGSVVRYIHDAEVTLYYPNVYTISNVSDDTNLFITWCYSDEDTTTFFNPIKEYMEYNPSYANDIINGTLPFAIKNYVPYESKYRELYYLDYAPKATRRNEFLFKFETLKDMIKDDTRRLEKIYVDSVVKTAYNWHSNPKYTIKMDNWGSYSNRVRRDNSSEIKHSNTDDFGMECVYFIIDHEDDRVYPIAVWIDGIRCHRTWQYTERYRTYVYVPKMCLTPNSLIEFEIMKTRDDKPTVVDMQLSSIHNSIMFPDEFIDMSPQSLMISTREETSDVEEDGGKQYIFKIAPNYEVYWLLIGNTEYVNGIPTYLLNDDIEEARKTDVVNALTSNASLLITEKNEALKLSTGSIWDKNSDGYEYLLEFGDDVSYIEAPSSEYPEDYTDIIKVRQLGYYGDARRRFYGYLPNGEDDAPIYITPITKYFADKWVRITNIDIHKEWHFVIDPNNKRVKLRDFRLEPSANKFRVFLDGRLLDPFKDYHFDASITNGFYLGSIVTFVIFEKITNAADLMIEYVPYRYDLKYRLDHVMNNNIQLRTTSITRPFSLVYYDVYLNGVKLYPDDITIVSPAKIIINREMNGSHLSIYERAHDRDIYDNERVMLQALVDKIAEEDLDFRKYLLPNVNTSPTPPPQTIRPSGSSGCGDCGSGCASACTGICENACSLTCSGSCKESCSSELSSRSCGGCSSSCGQECSTTCESNCKLSCTLECSNGCSGECTNSCAGVVSGQASGEDDIRVESGCSSCASLCTMSCTGDCSSTATSASCSGCGTTCIGECTGCQGSCTGTLTGLVGSSETCNGCSSACAGCGEMCSNQCTGTCIGCTNTCDSTCTSGCSEACDTTCFGYCTGCSGKTTGKTSSNIACAGCYSSCLSTCSNGCGENCSTGCSNTCGTSCGDSCMLSCSGACTGCTGCSRAAGTTA